MGPVPAFVLWFPGLAPKPPSAPGLVGPDADLLTLGATIGGEDICLSEEWSRNSVVIVGAPGRGRDSVLRSILGSVVAKGGGGIVMRSSPSGSLHRAVRKMAAARDRDDPQVLEDRQSVVEGQSESVGVVTGGGRTIKKKTISYTA